MTKRMREIMAQIETKTAQAKAFMADGDGKDVEKAEALMLDVESLKREYEVERRISEAEAESVPEEGISTPQKRDAVADFAFAARNGFKVFSAAQNETTAKDGGYTVPQDIRTKIEKHRDAQFSLRQLVSVEPVKTMSGRRTYLKRSTKNGFNKVNEQGKIGQMDAMEFEPVTYLIEKYGGYMPVTDELLADTDAALVNTIVEWIGDEARVTDNTLILTEIGTPEINIHSIDDIKQIINVTLGQAFAATTKIITNDDGLQYLDTLKDGQNRYLLSPDPADPMKMYLSVGARKIPLVIIPNNDMPTPIDSEVAQIPFIIGDLNAGIKLFDRQHLSIKVSDTASVTGFNAFEQDMTLFRAILREDVEIVDSAAFVACYYTPADDSEGE